MYFGLLASSPSLWPSFLTMVRTGRTSSSSYTFQTRTFEDLMAEIEKYRLSRPFANIYTWFPATVTVDGETYSEVGVRKKGFRVLRRKPGGGDACCNLVGAAGRGRGF